MIKNIDKYLTDYIQRPNSFYAFYAVLCVIMTFGFSFVTIFLKEKGFPLHMIIFLYALYTLVSILVIIFVNPFFTRKHLIYGIIFQALMLLVLAFYNPYSFILYAILAGFYQTFFWTTINYVFFKGTTANKNATNSSVYQFIPGLIGTAIPPLSILVINYYGYTVMYAISAISFVLSIFFFYKTVPDEKIEVPTFLGIKKFRGLKTITMIEGAFQYFAGVVITIYSLKFLKTETEFGLFLAFLGLIGLIISVILAKRSDNEHKRKGYLYVLFSLLILSILSLTLLKNQTYVIAAISVFTAFAYLSFPIRMAISIDAKKSDMSFWKTRELFLNIGRVPTLMLSSIFVFYDMFWAVFLMYATLLLLYMVLIRIKLTNIN